MTHKEDLPDSPGGAVRHIGRLYFEQADQPGVFRLSGVTPAEGELRILILFDGREYPFEKHYRYARHRGGRTPYTFSNTEFGEGAGTQGRTMARLAGNPRIPTRESEER